MEILIVLFAIYALACTCLALLWYIYKQHEDMFIEREEVRREHAALLTQNEIERRDLYDRIQAGTLPQYKEHVDAPNEVVEEEDETLSLEDAREELESA